MIFSRAIQYVMAVGLLGCAHSNTVDTPVSPAATSGTDMAAVESVRAYLRTFKLNERELTPGLTIPYAAFLSDGMGGTPEGRPGTARATGRLGPGGHQIYQLLEPHSLAQHFVEIAPE